MISFSQRPVDYLDKTNKGREVRKFYQQTIYRYKFCVLSLFTGYLQLMKSVFVFKILQVCHIVLKKIGQWVHSSGYPLVFAENWAQNSKTKIYTIQT